MRFFDEKKGTLALAKDCVLTPHMSAQDVFSAAIALGTALPEQGEEDIIPFPACEAGGGRIAAVAFMQRGRLSAVNLSVVSIGQKAKPAADQQRAFLFSLLCAKDPCPDTQRTCQLTCSFGHLLISTEPRIGSAFARIVYA